MTNERLVLWALLAVAVVMIFGSGLLIFNGPGGIDDVGSYQASEPEAGDPIAFSVSAGESPATIGNALEAVGAIDSGTQFEVLAGLMGYDSLLQAGDYEFQPGTPALDAVYRIRNGLVSTRSVTVVEGWRLEEIADSVAQQGIGREEFIAAASSVSYDYDFVRQIPAGQDLEGYLYPLTYTIRPSDTAQMVVEQMLEAYAQNVPADVSARAAAAGISLHEVVTIASIIQREARVREEKPIMAQVFLTRLSLGIPLEADPTVQYAITEVPENVAAHGYWKASLTEDDLAYDSLYNTYLYPGTPPGPISNPGADTILAVIQPSDTNYLYFVAKPDGSHAFAETLEDHLANIELYQGGQ
jgi:peptidoglycan lytic transglycosylase G